MGASDFLDTAIMTLRKSLAREGKELLPETAAKLSEIAKPIIAVPPKSYIQEVNQGRLLNSLLNSEAPEAVNPALVEAFSKGMRTVPDMYYDTFRPEIRFSKNPAELAIPNAEPGVFTMGRYHHRPNPAGVLTDRDIALNQYVDFNKNPNAVSSHAAKTPAHEVLHVGTYSGKDVIKNSPFASANDAVADVRGTSRLLQRMSPENQEKLKKLNAKIYDIRPDEVAANIFASRLTPFERDVPGLYKYSHEKAMTTLEDLLPAWAKKGREWGDLYRGVALPIAATGAYSLLQPKEGNTATLPVEAVGTANASQAKSNIDTTPWANAGVENIPAGVRKIPGKAWEGVKAVGGVVGNALEEIGRSGVKVADQGRSGKEFAPEPKDYVNVGMAALNPVTRGGMLVGEMAYDWFHSPAQTEANTPDPAEFNNDPNNPKWQFRTTPYEERTIPEVVQNIALGAGALGLGALAKKSKVLDNERGAVNIKNLFRGTRKVSDELTGDNLTRALYNLSPRAAYRAIDNPVGAAQFGDVFPVEMNIDKLFDPRTDPHAAVKVAKLVEEKTNLPPEKTLRNLLTGNWDAYEMGEGNLEGKLGTVQQVMKDAGYSGNWQLEPTKFQLGEWDPVRPFVNRRYQDVISTFAKPEISVGERIYTKDDLYERMRNAELKTRKKYQGGEELSPAEVKPEISSLVDPNILYDGEAFKFFHSDFKPMLEEFRPDAHFLSPNYENKHLFPPSREGFSLKSTRDELNRVVETTTAPGVGKTKSFEEGIGVLKKHIPFDPATANASDGPSAWSYAVHAGEFPTNYKPTTDEVKKFMKWEQEKVASLSDEDVDILHGYTAGAYNVFEEYLGEPAVKKAMDEFLTESYNTKSKFDVKMEDISDFIAGKYTPKMGEVVFTVGDEKIPESVYKNFKDEIADIKGVYADEVDENEVLSYLESMKINAKKVKAPNSALAEVNFDLPEKGVSLKKNYDINKAYSTNKNTYNPDNELDPNKVEYHTQKADGNLLDAMKSMYTGKPADTPDGAKLKAGLEKLTGFDSEKEILKTSMHLDDFPDWYLPSPGAKDKIASFVGDKVKDRNISKSAKDGISELGEVVYQKLQSYDKVYEYIKEAFDGNVTKPEPKFVKQLVSIVESTPEEVLDMYGKGSVPLKSTDLKALSPDAYNALNMVIKNNLYPKLGTIEGAKKFLADEKAKLLDLSDVADEL